MKKVYIDVVSCRRRSLDAKKLSNYLSKNNYEIVLKPGKADTIVLITCAFIDKITEYSLKKVKELQKFDAELIVAGCLPAIEPEKLSNIFNGKIIYTEKFDEIFQLFPSKKQFLNINEDANILFEDYYPVSFFKKIKKQIKKLKIFNKIYSKTIDFIFKSFFGKNSFTYKILLKNLFIIRISWGCLGNCSYCAIKKAIGPLKSKPQNQCLEELKVGLNQNYKYFLLTADDGGAYGLDICDNFPNLLKEMIKIKNDFKIYIESLSPIWLIKYEEELKEIISNKKVGYIDCAIQSGSEKILKSMNRFSDIKRLTDTLLNVKKLNPNLILTTEIIIGFPGETEDDFKQTLSLIKKINFTGGFIYRFSFKSGTKVENINPKNSQKDISKRIKYAKKYLKKLGYKINYLPKKDFIIFDKK